MPYRKLFKVLFAAILLISACQNQDEEKIPADILPLETMQEVLQEMLIVEAHLQERRLTPDSAKIFAQQFYMQIFDRHNVEQEVFFKSMEFYVRQPRILEKAFLPIIDSLSSLEATMNQ